MGGIGIASGVVSFNVALYYNTIIAWCLFYFVQSFRYPLPWAECPDDPATNQTVAECEVKKTVTESAVFSLRSYSVGWAISFV